MARRGITTLFSPAGVANPCADVGLSPQTLLLAVVGRIAPEKNLELAVSAMGAVAAAGIDYQLLLVGDGRPRRSPQLIRGDLCRHAQWGRSRPALRVGRSLPVPSLTETFGNVTTEKRWRGLPVIGFDYAAAALRVRSGINGWLARKGDEQGLHRGDAEGCGRPVAETGDGIERPRECAPDADWERSPGAWLR